jgi:hypothetical protein
VNYGIKWGKDTLAVVPQTRAGGRASNTGGRRSTLLILLHYVNIDNVEIQSFIPILLWK